MARMVNAVIGKKNKTWCDNFMLEAMPPAHNRSHPWRDNKVRAINRFSRAINRAATMGHPASVETSGFMINVLLQTLKAKPPCGFAASRGDQRAPRAAKGDAKGGSRSCGGRPKGCRSRETRQGAPAPRVSAGPAAQKSRI